VNSLYERDAKVRHVAKCIMSVNSIHDLVVNNLLSRWESSPAIRVRMVMFCGSKWLLRGLRGR
jgi:hypothetical protein